MKGKVFIYGAQGDPLVIPKSGGKIVVLKGYNERPEIGTEIDYNVSRQGKSVVYGTIQQASQKSLAEVQRAQENPLERGLNEIQALWDESFSEHMTDEAKVAFPKELQDIKERYQQGYYEAAAKIANENYKWASDRSDFCDGTGPGFAYFPMFRAFESLEKLIRKSAYSVQASEGIFQR